MEKKFFLSAHIKSFLRFEQIHCIENTFMLYSEQEVMVMWDDILEFILLIFDDIIGFFWHGRKERKERKKQQEEADEKQRKADRERPL